MLQSRNLDDQSFEQIMEFAMARLPWLCPSWTDYNAHDPGITILELMAWYKEMQQYHLNTVTDEMRKKLLKLLGIRPTPPKSASCFIELPVQRGVIYPPLSRLDSAQNVPFELLGAAQADTKVEALYVIGTDFLADMTKIIGQQGIAIWPFDDGERQTRLIIGLDNAPKVLRLWFEIDDARSVPRNRFTSDTKTPRIISWSLAGLGQVSPISDETHALSVSGFITFELPDSFEKTDGMCGLPPRYYIMAEQTDAGCEEQVRLSDVSADRFVALQQETWAKLSRFTVKEGLVTLILDDAVSQDGVFYAFVREPSGLRVAKVAAKECGAGIEVTLNADGCAMDEKPNLFIVSLDQLHYGEMLFPSTGLPDMTIDIMLGGRSILPDSMMLICDTMCEDGQVRPAIWHNVDDLSMAGSRDRVFAYDPIREQIVFGNGLHGAVVPRGESGVLAAQLVLSYCGAGNLPQGCGLTFADGLSVYNTAASGGMDGKSVEYAAWELLRSFEHTSKCASEADYENAARNTPGLRVAAAKAIAGFDPDEPTGTSRIPIVTVVVVPYSAKTLPVPDARFIQAVQEYLERQRPICTAVKVVAPAYVPIGVAVKITAKGDVREKVHNAVVEYLRVVSGGRGIGDPLVKDDLIQSIMRLGGVLKVERLELRPIGTDCYPNAQGDLLFKRNAVAFLSVFDAQIR